MRGLQELAVAWVEWVLACVYGVVVGVYLAWSWCKGALAEAKDRDAPPLCLQDPALGLHRLIKLQSVKLHYLEAGDPSKPLVVLIHGHPDFWFSWRKQIPALAQEYWVVAPDLRGCGDSDAPLLRTHYTIDAVAQDVASLIRVLGRERSHVVCSGAGGGVGWHLAYHYPQLVDKLVLIHSPHPYVARQVVRTRWTHYFKAWWLYFLRLPLLPELAAGVNDCGLVDRLFGPLVKLGQVSQEEVDAYKYNFCRRADWTGTLHHLRQLDLSPVDPELPQPDVITKPTLLFMGDADPLLPIEAAYRSAEYVERINIKPLPGTGYYGHVTHPDLVNRAVAEFLREMPWRPLSPLQPAQPSIVGRVMGASLAAVSNTYNKTNEAITLTKSLPGSLLGAGLGMVKMAESTLGLQGI